MRFKCISRKCCKTEMRSDDAGKWRKYNQQQEGSGSLKHNHSVRRQPKSFANKPDFSLRVGGSTIPRVVVESHGRQGSQVGMNWRQFQLQCPLTCCWGRQLAAHEEIGESCSPCVHFLSGSLTPHSYMLLGIEAPARNQVAKHGPHVLRGGEVFGRIRKLCLLRFNSYF